MVRRGPSVQHLNCRRALLQNRNAWNDRCWLIAKWLKRLAKRIAWSSGGGPGGSGWGFNPPLTRSRASSESSSMVILLSVITSLQEEGLFPQRRTTSGLTDFFARPGDLSGGR